MADIVIRNITSLDDLVEATAHLFRTIGEGSIDMFREGTFTIERGPWIPSDLDLEYLVGIDDEFDCLTDEHGEFCTCVSDARTFDPRQGVVVDVPQGLPYYVPCPQRGHHTRLTDCWMCWCDVNRGDISLADALAGETIR